MRRRGWRNELAPRPTRGRVRRLRGALLGASLAGGALAGALAGDALLARAFPERAAQVRLALVGNRHADALELAAAAGVGPGVPLATLDLAAVRAGVAAHPWVRSVRVAALPPDRLIVAVEEREAVAVAAIGGARWLVDRDGIAFVHAPDGAALPALAGAAARDDARLADGVAWLAALAAHRLPAPAELVLADADPARAPAFSLPGAGVVPGARVLLGVGERDAKLARLARLLAAGLPETANAAEIDLRFGADVILRAVSPAAGPVPPGAQQAQRAKPQVGG
jgi:cell division protein FtsQ